MKSLLALLLLISAPAWAIPGTASIGALTTNPAANAVLVTSGALNSGSPNSAAHWLLNLTCSGSAAFTCAFQVMNGASVVSTFYLQVPAGQTVSFAPEVSFSIPQGYTLRVITPTLVVGQVQASVIYAIDTVD